MAVPSVQHVNVTLLSTPLQLLFGQRVYGQVLHSVMTMLWLGRSATASGKSAGRRKARYWKYMINL